MGIDLSLLPPPAVIEALDFEAIVAAHKADFLARYPAGADVIDLESEPIVKLIESGAYRELLLRARYNDEARALLLPYATGTDLDHIGVTYYDGETRLLITPGDATTTPPTPAVYESDDDYRERLAMKPRSYSVAGPRDAYLFHARSASGQVKHASVTSPNGGTTEVFLLSRTGSGVPDPALLAIVAAALNDEAIRPLSEEVIVSPAGIRTYQLAIGLVLFPGATGEVALQAARAALEAFAAAHHKLGADIILSAIDATAHQSGVKQVIIDSPASNVICNDGEAPWCTGITLSIVGVEP